jgi:hypothetical protein
MDDKDFLMDRLLSLSVGTDGSEDYIRTFQDLSELVKSLGESHDYVNVSACAVNEVDEDSAEELCYDENTLFKVRAAVEKAVRDSLGGNGPAIIDSVVANIINEIQNEGILFRERKHS